MGTNHNRINKIEPFSPDFNFENINYPFKKEDYETFEKNNESISLIIFKPGNDKKKVYYHFKSKNLDRRTKIFYYF